MSILDFEACESTDNFLLRKHNTEDTDFETFQSTNSVAVDEKTSDDFLGKKI